ncbi:MAG: hypothetical protein ACK5L3_07860 [Oscillospiraceae bacterium]
MKQKHLPRLIAMVMAVALLFSGCALPFELPFELPWQSNSALGDRCTIPYSEMEYSRPDVEGIKTRLAELTTLVEQAGSIGDVLKYDEEASAMLENFSSMSSLAELKNYHDSTDTFYEEEYRYCKEGGVELSNALNKYNMAIVEGPFAEEYRKEVGDYVFKSIQNDLLLNSDSVEAFKKERSQINIDYNNTLSALTLTYEGQEYTMADIENLYYTDGYDTYIKLLTLYYKTNAETFTNFYRQMIELDKQTSYELGFASTAEMYYLSYSRDYTPEDAKTIAENCKAIFVPIAGQINAQSFSTDKISLARAMKTMPDSLAKISPELESAWQHMVTYGLYDYAPAENKQTGIAFTTEIPSYDAPFCYGSWDDSFSSATTMIHEFGHYYDNWLRYDTSVVFNLDIAEIYSQGLEVLMQENFADFTNNPDSARAQNLQDFTNPLTFQVMLEDFQQQVYALDTFDADVIARLYATLLEEYGLQDYGLADENGCDYSWFRITHLFDAPFYTISYTTSALVALQIWAASQDDWQTGVDMYLNLIHADQNQPFIQLVEGAGFADPTSADTMQTIAGHLADTFGVQAGAAAA